MRRFSASAFQKTRKHDLEFLTHPLSPTLPSVRPRHHENIPGSQNHTEKGNIKLGKNSPAKITAKVPSLLVGQTKLNTTRGVKLLATAVVEGKYDSMEAIFAAVPRLSERPSAMRLLIKAYCERLDFVSARAVLFASLDRVGDAGVARYIVHATYLARNPALIEDAFGRLCAFHVANNTDLSSDVAAAALYGLRLLDDMPAFNGVWNRLKQFWEPSLKAPTLSAKALDSLLAGHWEESVKLFRIAKGMQSYSDVRSARIWYMALRYYLVESPYIEGVERVLGIMHDMQIHVTREMTALLLRHLSALQPGQTPQYWLQNARDRGWPMDSLCTEIVVHNFARKLPAQMQLALHAYTNSQLQSAGLLHRRKHPLGEKEEPFDFVPELLNCKTPHGVIALLRAYLKRGLRLPYNCFTLAFKRVVDLQDVTESTEVAEIVKLIREMGYSVHSASTDLIMLESNCKTIVKGSGDLGGARILVKQLVGEYLVQYPLVGLDLAQRTRLALLTADLGGDYTLAITIADSLRQEQVPYGGVYGPANHDSVSLQTICRCKGRLREPVAAFIRAVLADDAGIYFDKRFIKSVRDILRRNSEEPDVLMEVEQANKRVEARCKRDVDEAIAVLAAEPGV